MGPILEVKNLVKYYPGVKAVDGVDFSIDPGSCFGLLGPNGAGKTTTIEVIEGILEAKTGNILYNGAPRGRKFKENIGIQFQNTELPQFLTVHETLKLFTSFYKNPSAIEDLITTCRLEEVIDRDNSKISGGQKQRLLLAMALANNPDLLFLDEPTTGLDPQARRHVWEIIRKIKNEGKTIVLTTHYMEEAETLCEVIAIMDYGKIITMGTPRDLLKKFEFGNTITLPRTLSDAILEGLDCKWFRSDGSIEIHTNAINLCLSTLLERGIDLGSITIRSPNIEDLFLHLTGHNLRS